LQEEICREALFIKSFTNSSGDNCINNNNGLFGYRDPQQQEEHHPQLLRDLEQVSVLQSIGTTFDMGNDDGGDDDERTDFLSAKEGLLLAKVPSKIAFFESPVDEVPLINSINVSFPNNSNDNDDGIEKPAEIGATTRFGNRRLLRIRELKKTTKKKKKKSQTTSVDQTKVTSNNQRKSSWMHRRLPMKSSIVIPKKRIINVLSKSSTKEN
jgi:hypothetical protein